MNNLINTLKNYKTTIPGILGIICVGLNFAGIITNEQLTIGVGVLVSVGLMGAKDHSNIN